jgi:hypothetical protein
MTTIKLNFTIPVTLYSTNKHKQVKNITQKHIAAINNNIKYNGKLNSQNNIISSTYGIITLISTSINGINDILTFSIIAKTENIICELSTEAAEDIIWAILPASYSSDDSYTFRFSIDCLFNIENYVLNILEVPTNITIQKY